jgi:3-oxoacyl-[acyl-carrier protein] reductase
MDFKEKTAIVTGAASGLGKAIAKKLASMGATTIIGDTKDEVNLVAKQITQDFGTNCLGLKVDVSNYDSCREFYERGIEILKVEGVDVLVNNAGINRDSFFLNMTYEQWDQVIKVDLYSMFNCTKQVVPAMLRKGYGRIINISSMSWLGNIAQANYSAAKAGVIGFTKALAKELAKNGVTVNAVCPGFIDTPMTRSVPEKVRQKFLNRIPVGRIGVPEDVANVVVFLASDWASYITGEVINVSGGLTM